MLIFLSFAGPPASCVHCGRNFSRNETELFIKPERSGTAFRLQVLSRQDLFLSAQRCSGLDEPGGRGCPLRTVEKRRHLGCVLCSPMYRCVSLRAKACPQGTSPSARRPYNRSFSCPEEKKSFRPVIGRKLSLVFTTCYNILRHTGPSYASP